MATEAGRGDARVYRIMPKSPSDTAQLKVKKHYVGIDAAAWFVNKADSWLSRKTISGIIQIRMGAAEVYEVGLGTFELRGGMRIAPVFAKPLLPDRNYLGGPVTITCTLSAIRRDTVIAAMLKSAGDASLGVVAGMIDTAGLAGPSQLLAAAGSSLVGSVRDVLTTTGPDREEIFTPMGVEYTLHPRDLTGSHIYLLIHRGAELDRTKLVVGGSNELKMPFYETNELQDGAWVLLRIRRSDEYLGVRDWYQDMRALRDRITNVVNDAATGFRTKEDALAEFTATPAGDKTIADVFTALRARIQSDGVLCERQAGTFVGSLRQRIVAARHAVQTGNYSAATEDVLSATDALSEGRSPEGEMGSVFVDEMTSLAMTRRGTLIHAGDPSSIGDLSADNVFDELRHIPKTLAELA